MNFHFCHRLTLTVLALLSVIAAGRVEALPISRNVSSTEIVAISVTDASGKEVSLYCLGTNSGKIVNKATGLFFKSLADDVAKQKKKASTNPKFKPKLKVTRQLKAKGDAMCRQVSMILPTPTPTLAPGQPTPIPTPPLDPRAMFDYSGNVTFLGKQYLGIPANLQANIDRGDAAFQFNCSGCHVQPAGYYRYPEVSARIQLDPMFLTIPERVSQQSVADIIAYFNRFKLAVP